jgi:hypothetical protein
MSFCDVCNQKIRCPDEYERSFLYACPICDTPVEERMYNVIQRLALEKREMIPKIIVMEEISRRLG